MNSPQVEPGRYRLRSNVIANVSFFVLSVGVGLWFTPYLIGHLGVAVYGLVPLATSVTAYMSVLTIALSGSVGRFITVAVARGDSSDANRTFNTAFFATLCLVLVLAPVAAAIAFFAPAVINIPVGQENGTRWLLMATMSGFLATALGASFAASSFARSRFDVRSGINALALVSRVGIVVLLFTAIAPRLWYVGIAVFSANLCWLAGHIWAWRRLTPELRLTGSDFDPSRLRVLTSTGAWLVVNQAGSLLFLGVDLLLVNMLAGATAAGSYAPVLQWSRVLRSLAAVVAGVLAPTIVAYHARGDREGLARIASLAVKTLGLALALPVGLLCGLGRPLLVAWLGPEFGRFTPLMWLLVGPLCVNLAVIPLFSVQLALNKVRWPGIITLTMGAGSVGLAITLAGPLGWGMYGVAAASAIMLTLKNTVYTPLYAAHILGQPVKAFLMPIVGSLAALAFVASAGLLLCSAFGLDSWWGVLKAGAVVSLVYGVLAFFGLLSRRERNTVLSIALGARGRAR